MNFGMIVRHALSKANLPIDASHLELAKTECNLIIQDIWYKGRPNWRQSRGQINTIDGANEFLLSKYFDGFVHNTLQGPSTNPICYYYFTTEEFHRKVRVHSEAGGGSFIFTYGDIVGFDKQLDNASRLRCFSSLASKTTGSVNVINGSDRVTSNADLFTLNDVGLRLKRSGDSKSYKISRYVSPREITLEESYRGQSGSDVAYEIGDVGIHVNVTGFVGGEMTSEDMELNGSNVINGTLTFNSIVSISKSERTGGRITVQNQSGSETLGVMAGGETEIERQTIVLWPNASGSEALTYRYYLRHPQLWLDSDRLLIPEKWHRLVNYNLEHELRSWAGEEIPQRLIDKIKDQEFKLENEMEDIENMSAIPDSDDEDRFGDSFYYDRFRDSIR